MYPISNPELQRLVIEQHHDDLRRAAGVGRLRRDNRRRRRHRARPGPDPLS